MALRHFYTTLVLLPLEPSRPGLCFWLPISFKIGYGFQQLYFVPSKAFPASAKIALVSS
jgi:hypothetical protein